MKEDEIEINEEQRTKSLVLQKRELPFSFIQTPQNLNGGFSNKKETGFKILESVVIAATSGKRLITKSDIFNSFIDSDFKNWDLENWEESRPIASFLICEIDEDTPFPQMFTKINSNLDDLVVTQDQIIYFCEKYPGKINRDGCQVFFLIKRDKEYFKEYFVVGVSRTPNPNNLAVFVYRIDREVPIYARYHHRLVIPIKEIFQ